MKEQKMIEVTNQRLQDFSKGLQLFLSKVHPDPLSTQRGVIYYKQLEPALIGLQKILLPWEDKELQVKELGDDPRAAVMQREINGALRKINEGKVSIPAPAVKLTAKDLPHRLKGKDGELNTVHNGLIQALLSPEFLEIGDPDAEPKEPKIEE